MIPAHLCITFHLPILKRKILNVDKLLAAVVVSSIVLHLRDIYMHVEFKIQKKEAALLRGGGGGFSGGPPQVAEYKGQQGIVNILSKKSGLSAFNTFYNNLLFSCVDCFIDIFFNFQTK